MRMSIANPSVKIAVLMCLLTALTGCSDHPVLSPKGNDLSMALYTACKRHDQEALAKLTTLTKTAQDNSEITENEALLIQEIIARANQRQQWDEAARLARELLEAQVQGN